MTEQYRDRSSDLLPSAVVSLLPLNQHPFSSALPCPFDSDASIQSVGWHRCDRNDEDEHWGCSGCQHLVGLVKSDGVYILLALEMVARTYHYCRILAMGRHQNAEGNNNASSPPYSSCDTVVAPRIIMSSSLTERGPDIQVDNRIV